jgi:signal transduction histidine kinase
MHLPLWRRGSPSRTGVEPAFLRSPRWYVDPLAWTLIGAVFLLDLWIPEDYAIGLFYPVVFLLGLITAKPKSVLYLASVATLLIFVEYGVSPVESAWTVGVANRALEIIVLWVTASTVYVHRQGHLQRERAEQHAKASEEQLRQNTALAQVGKLAAVVAHEVRNPIAGIRGAMQVLTRRLAPDAPEQKIAREMITRLDTLNDMVTDLLHFVRPRQPVFAQMSFRQLTASTIGVLHDDPALADVVIDVQGEDVMLMADAELLKLVLHNLLVNSGQAMDGRGRIVVTASSQEGTCEIRVADQGPGIPAETRRRLFEPFFTTKQHGTGLGLATARRFVEAHDGTLDLTSPPEGGATAIIRLPCEVVGTA